jgi:hypothetical protein
VYFSPFHHCTASLSLFLYCSFSKVVLRFLDKPQSSIFLYYSFSFYETFTLFVNLSSFLKEFLNNNITCWLATTYVLKFFLFLVLLRCFNSNYFYSLKLYCYQTGDRIFTYISNTVMLCSLVIRKQGFHY